MEQNEILKRFMINDLLKYLVNEKILDYKNYRMENVYLKSYEDREKITLHLVATINKVGWLVERTFINLDSSILNIYKRTGEGALDFDLVKMELSNK